MGLTYTGTIAPGQELVIDLAHRRALRAGANAREDVSGEWFELPVGPSRLRITASPGTVSAEVSIRYRERYG